MRWGVIILNRVMFGQLDAPKGVGRVFDQVHSKMQHVLKELQWWMERGEWGGAGVGNEAPEIGGYYTGQGHWLLLCAR